MSKRILLISFFSLILILAMGFLSLSYAYQAIVLSDAELDNVSAAGFDINLGAVLALRAAVAAQRNINAVIAQKGNIKGVTIHNRNTLNAPSVSAGISEQKNVTVVVALEGKVEETSINNNNTATITNPQDLTQSNVSIIMAQGNVEDSSISNANFLNTPGAESYSSTLASVVTQNINQLSINYSILANQTNLEVIISLVGEIKNTFVNSSHNVN